MANDTQQSPFYKSFAFWLSLAALLVSALSLTISFVNSPYFGLVGADIVYWCPGPDPTPGEQESFPVFVSNQGNAPAEDVIVTIGTVGDGDKATFFLKGGYQEYSILKKEKMWVVLKIPRIAQHSILTIRVSDCKPSGGFMQTNFLTMQDYAVYVIHKTGVGRWEPPPK